MKHILLAFICLLVGSNVILAQYNIKGRVTDAETEKALKGARVAIERKNISTRTDNGGSFELEGVPTGTHTLTIQYRGYEVEQKKISIKGKGVTMYFRLRGVPKERSAKNDTANQENSLIPMVIEEVLIDDIEEIMQGDDFVEVVVIGTKAGEKTPTTYTNLTKEDIERNNLGVDVPYLLDLTPSVVVTSDAGTGIGYTGIRVRGSDPTRTNVQINGIPLNDAESMGTFWVNLPDFASSVNNIQIQRGVGTSTNGAGAFGATINLETNKLNMEPYATLSNTVGSFNTLKNNISVGTGLLNKKFSFDARLSRIYSDGFIDRARADLKSYYLSGAYLGKKHSLRLNVFSGHEITYQAWNGVPLSEIEAENFSFNPSGYVNDSTFHNDEVDNYRQTHYQAHYTQYVNPKLSFKTSLHYTKGKGYFEQYKNGEGLSDYGITEPIYQYNEDSTTYDLITETDLIRRRWLDNDYYGITANVEYEFTNALEAVFGGAYSIYEGKHYGEVIWAQYAANTAIYDRYYDNDATKKDFNIFSKFNYQAHRNLNVFADIQLRLLNYDFLGIDVNDDGEIQPLQQEDNLTFFNPKLGATYLISNNSKMYGSWALAHKEPNRSDYTEAPINERPRPERLSDFELGYQIGFPKFNIAANVYYMIYKDQLALNGGINDVGEYTRINIDESYRRGLELSGVYRITDFLNWRANATLSQNRVVEFTEEIDAYNAENGYALEKVLLTHQNTDLAFSPGLIVGSQLEATIFDYKLFADTSKAHKLDIALLTKYVGKQYIDNTSNQNANLEEEEFIQGTADDFTSTIDDGIAINNRFLDPYISADLRITYGLKNVIGKEIELNFLVRNLLNKNYITNAYAYRYISDKVLYEGEGYFPQAGLNYLLGLTFKF
mgnify:CR=1 FL=1